MKKKDPSVCEYKTVTMSAALTAKNLKKLKATKGQQKMTLFHLPRPAPTQAVVPAPEAAMAAAAQIRAANTVAATVFDPEAIRSWPSATSAIVRGWVDVCRLASRGSKQLVMFLFFEEGD
jgi:hypothetical protein